MFATVSSKQSSAEGTESRWVLQKWEEEVEVGKILHPTQSHAESTPSSPCALPPTSPHPDGNSNLPAIASLNASLASPPLAMEELDVPPPSGSQLDVNFLRSLCGKYGPFDVVVDDGGHTAEMIKTSLATLFAHNQCMTSKSLYVVEDLHVMMQCKAGFCKHPSDVYMIFSQIHFGMHFNSLAHSKQKLVPKWQKLVQGMHLYPSIAFLERGDQVKPLQSISRGQNVFPYDAAPPMT